MQDESVGLMTAHANLVHESHSAERRLRRLAANMMDASKSVEACRAELSHVKDEVRARLQRFSR